LNPDSWLYRDVRRRVEDVFLRNDDLGGLAKYYEKWLEKNPTDVDAVARLAKTLASQGRAPEARSWLEKGIAAAPGNRALRQALIDQYVFEQNFAAAAGQYEAMDKADPNNPDTLREWGRLLARDPARPEADRRAAAAAVWKRLLDRKPTDPVTTSQVADLLRGAGATDDAVALYRKAVSLSPASAQYREYLGEYLHSLKRSDEALATWRPIAEGPNRSAKNLARLAEVFAGFGYRTEAIAALGRRAEPRPGGLQPPDDARGPVAPGRAERRGASSRSTRPASGPATRRRSNRSSPPRSRSSRRPTSWVTGSTSCRRSWTPGPTPRPPGGSGWPGTTRPTGRPTRRPRRSARPPPRTPSRSPSRSPRRAFFEGGGDLLAAADANRKLAALDRRYRSEYLTAVAKLEQKLGRRDQALQAGRDLLAASPGNPETYKFFADCASNSATRTRGSKPSAGPSGPTRPTRRGSSP
jgi:tetratricopeptide (TPR) repeat protein